ncbi:tonsoku-like protein isoform X1 [Montipora foliosa]|uniref:tonsoku-like protein isoform X1 n=1 Tax=Montipora foliosa TaxID=591990 RepID=UPI0035F19A61
MEASLQRELKQLNKQKLRAQDKGDLAEEAKLCNAVGELLAQYGYFEKAVKEHSREVQLSEATQDTIGSAVAHRKVGECLCALKKYKEALFHQNLHLELAQSANNLVEEQRALATIGRTWFVHSGDAISPDEQEEYLLESQAAYLKSLSAVEKLQGGTVSNKQLLEMKSRLYLNLGLTYEKDSQEDCTRAKSFMEKALVIARDQGLRDTEYRCLLSIGSIQMKSNDDAHALRCFEQALLVARHDNNKFHEADALDMLGKVFLKLGEFSAARLNLKKAYQIIKTKRSDDMEELKSNLATAIKGARCQRKHAKLSEYPLDNQVKILDQLGDLYCQAKAYTKALGCYKKELELAKSAGMSHKELSPIYVSLAITYSDLKCPDDAISCYLEELEIMEEGNYKEMCETWCNIAYVHEKAGHDYDEIKDSYFKALKFAELSGKQQAELRVWKCLLDTQKLFGADEYAKSAEKVAEIEAQFGIEDSGDESEKSGDICEDNDNDDALEALIEREMLLSDSDEDNFDDEYEGEGSRRKTNATRTRRSQRKAVNEKGETPLHEAAIAGNLQRVEALLEKGADVNARDYCGWLPLHEACNHGHVEIVELLLKAGSDVNDQGGEHCFGVTPLHDAAENGHLDVVKLLLKYGASINLKDGRGRTSLDATLQVLERNVDDRDDTFTIGRKEVVKHLRRQKEKKGDVELRRRNLIHGESKLDGEEEESSASTLQRFNEKLKQKEKDRKQRMNTDLYEGDEICSSMFEDIQYPSSIHENKLIEEETSEPVLSFTPSFHCHGENGVYSVNTETTASADFIENEELDMHDLGNENDIYSETNSLIEPFQEVETSNQRSSLVPSLVTQKTSQWLVDDIGPRNAKRKRPAKQTKLPGFVEQRKRYSAPAKPSLPQNNNNYCKSKFSRPKQTTLSVAKEPGRVQKNAVSNLDSSGTVISTPPIARHHVNSNVPVGHSRKTSPEINSQRIVAPSGTPPMRLRVRVQDKVFLIPCPQNNAQDGKNIGWLAEQASLRYFSSFGLRPVLALKTSEGAFLSLEDKIRDVLSSNEEVLGSVESWNLPALSERYRDACINSNTASRPDILSILESDLQLTSISLSNKALLDVHVLPLYRALQCHDVLTKLMLPGNRIGDSGVQYLVSALPTLPNLLVLDLSCNGITQKGLSHIASALNARDCATERSERQQNAMLQKLMELNISYNWLGDNCGTLLAVILQKCPLLNSLKLESCGLTSQISALGKEFPVALKASRLSHLSVAYNALGSQGMTNFIEALPSESLHHFNVTSSYNEKENQSAVHGLVYFMESGTVLTELVLGDCCVGDKEIEILLKAKHMFTALHYLDLSCNCIGNDGITMLLRLLKDSKLSILILAGNTDIEAAITESLLLAAKDSKTLQRLNLSACGIKSPLDTTFFDSLRTVASNSDGCLKEVNMSYNNLSVEDKKTLEEDWQSCSSGESSVCLENSLCVFTK